MSKVYNIISKHYVATYEDAMYVPFRCVLK